MRREWVGGDVVTLVQEPPVCGACMGEGGGGDDRCAIVICVECDGTGLWRPGAPCPCGCGARGATLSGVGHVSGCGDPADGAIRGCPTCGSPSGVGGGHVPNVRM